jgi:hypothetical protein
MGLEINMQRNNSERAASGRADLAGQYRPIGPAAVLAALLCAAKKLDEAEEARKAA